ncbi:MAG: zinc ribbon domain-containing protein [Anaerolineaceae bacterium]|nr:zinc ribbon domain-containing protein [Anaerolineaceae bacterium]
METKLIHMKCQNCGANLDIDLDHLTAFCPYCGEKLMIDVEKLGDVLIEKEKTKQKEMEFNNKIQYEEVVNEEKRKNKKNEFNDDVKRTIILMVGLLLIFLFFVIVSRFVE